MYLWRSAAARHSPTGTTVTSAADSTPHTRCSIARPDSVSSAMDRGGALGGCLAGCGAGGGGGAFVAMLLVVVVAVAVAEAAEASARRRPIRAVGRRRRWNAAAAP